MKHKNTHTVQQVEQLMFDYVNMIKNARTKEEKKALLKELKNTERFWNDIEEKNDNSKQYPERMYHSDDKPMNKEEIIELIKSVNIPKDEEYEKSKMDMELRGIFVTEPQI